MFHYWEKQGLLPVSATGHAQTTNKCTIWWLEVMERSHSTCHDVTRRIKCATAVSWSASYQTLNRQKLLIWFHLKNVRNWEQMWKWRRRTHVWVCSHKLTWTHCTLNLWTSISSPVMRCVRWKSVTGNCSWVAKKDKETRSRGPSESKLN